MTWRHLPDRPGGSAYGAHFWKTWDSCRKKGFFRYRAPHPEGEGLLTRYTNRNLLKGSGFHDGIEAWYKSGWRDGQYSLDAALQACEESCHARKDEWEDSLTYNDDLTEAKQLLQGYHAWYGPGGKDPEWPDLQVLADAEGEPLIEREFTMDLGGHPYTCRADAIVRWRKWIYVLEHKTCDVRGVTRLRNQLRMDSQILGEALVLQRCLPEELTVQGVIINIVVKNRGARSTVAPFVRDPISLAQGLLDTYDLSLQSKHADLDRLNDEYDQYVADGDDPWATAHHVFPLDGVSNGCCFSYNRACEYMELCSGVGLEERFIPAFKASRRFEPTEVEDDA